MYISRHTWIRDGFMLLWETGLQLRAVTFRGGKGRAGSAPSTATPVKPMLALLTPTHPLGTTEETFHTHTPLQLPPKTPNKIGTKKVKQAGLDN